MLWAAQIRVSRNGHEDEQRSFAECVAAAPRWAAGKPFGGRGSSGHSKMQSLKNCFPKQLPEITEGESEHAVFPFLFALQGGDRH